MLAGVYSAEYVFQLTTSRRGRRGIAPMWKAHDSVSTHDLTKRSTHHLSNTDHIDRKVPTTRHQLKKSSNPDSPSSSPEYSSPSPFASGSAPPEFLSELVLLEGT